MYEYHLLIGEENDLNKFLNLLKCSNKIKRETKILNLSLSYDFKTKLDMKKFLYKYLQIHLYNKSL